MPNFVLSGHCRYKAVFRFLKMTAVRHLGFLKLRKFTCRRFGGPICVILPYFILTAARLQRGNMRHLVKFRLDRSKCSGDMVIWQFFKMAAVRHLGFIKLKIVTSMPVRRPNMPCVIMPNFVLIGRTIVHADMAVFDFSRRRPSAIFDFQKIEI